jgi:hypothetical protein
MGDTWSIDGEYLEACSCDFVCPCITSNATTHATEDFCVFAMTYRIDRGRFASLDLAGVTFVGTIAGSIGTILEQSIEGIPSAAIANAYLGIDNTFHPAGPRLNLATARQSIVDCFGIRWNDTSGHKNGHFAPFSWRGERASYAGERVS